MRKYWIEQLPGIPPLPPCPAGYNRPDRVAAAFVEDGYFIEYFEYPFDRNRTVALFYGPGEFIIRAHPVFSTVEALDRACAANFSYSHIFRTLRGFPETKEHYRHIKGLHEKKVDDRLQMASMSCPGDRIRFVREKQPWVMKKASNNLVAGYLGITVGELKQLRKG